MKSNYGQMKRTGLGAGTRALIAAVILAFALPASAQTFKTLINFNNTNGDQPVDENLVQGLNGNLYGTTYLAGAHGNGQVFKMTPAGVISTVYSFCSVASCDDGNSPAAALLLGTDGNLYGTTRYQGSGGCGTVFKLTPAGVLTVLHAFVSTDGCYPTIGLMQASNGLFYGTTPAGGAAGFGVLYQVSSTGVFKVIHTFDGTLAGGGVPGGTVMQATNGSLYGGTVAPGPSVIYQTNLTGTVFHTYPFSASNADVSGPLIQASNGNIYGTTSFAPGYGTFFRVTPAGVITTLYSFCSLANCADGSQPLQGVIQASDGNFYGTTYGGGANNDGTIFKITAAGVLTTLHSFNATDGDNIDSGIFQNTNGTLYGLTHNGGPDNSGTVYSLTNKLPAFVHTITPGGAVGARVVILGNTLTGATAVSFNGTAATFKVVSNTEITTTVPVGATSGKLTVTAASGTLSSDRTYRVTPKVTTFSPASGPVGTSVTITGASLTQTSKVAFGGKTATFTVDSDTQVTATVPTGAVTGRIAITTAGGTASSATSFTVN
jgi:uncharacterized repeat protein (TIGR03803 family)